MKNLSGETVNRATCLSGNQWGLLSWTATIALLLAITLSPYIAVSAAEFSLSAPILFKCAVDGSAAANVGDGFFVGATDENNVLRLYSTTDGAKVKELLSLNFGFPLNKKGQDS